MKKAIIILFLFNITYANLAQVVNLYNQKDTFNLENIFPSIEKLSFSKQINITQFNNYYWELNKLQNKDEVANKKIQDLSIQLGDIMFAVIAKQYVDSICTECSDIKKQFVYWYLMNYFFVPTGLLYNLQKGNILNICPCIIKNIQYPDEGMYIVDSLSHLYCIPIGSQSNISYNKIYTFYPLLKNWKKYVTNWEKIFNQNMKIDTLIYKRPFRFLFNGTIYSDTISFNIKKGDMYKYIPSLGKDNSILNENLDYNIDTSLVKYLRNKITKFNNIDKINFILSFVQQCIENKTDEELLNVGDKTLLPEVTLYKAAGDCEDKAFLLAFLFKQLLHDSRVVIIIYENHVAVGVSEKNISSNTTFIKYKNKKFIICETTNNFAAGKQADSEIYKRVLSILPVEH